MLRSTAATLLAVVAMVKSGLARVNRRAGEEFLKTIEAADDDMPGALRPGAMTRAAALKRSTKGQLGLGTLLAAFVVVVAAFVVILVIDEFDASLGTPSSSALSSSSNDVLSGFASMASLIEPLLLIGIGVVIIGLIRRVQTT